MTKQPNIFDDENKVMSKFFDFKEVGDQVQGTYIRRVEVDNDRFRGNCYNYEIKTAEGEIWVVNGGKEKKGVLDSNMNSVTPGQIVGFKLVELRDTGKVNKAKIIEVFANAKLIDEDWLQKQEELKSGEESAKEEEVNATEENAPAESEEPAPAAKVPTDKVSAIHELAKQKLGVIKAEEVKDKVMETTTLAFLPANLDEIIAKLEEMPNK